MKIKTAPHLGRTMASESLIKNGKIMSRENTGKINLIQIIKPGLKIITVNLADTHQLLSH